jgi:hypothetical protein
LAESVSASDNYGWCDKPRFESQSQRERGIETEYVGRPILALLPC